MSPVAQTAQRHTMYVWPVSPDNNRLVWCSESCCRNAIVDPPEDWLLEATAVVVPDVLVPFVTCYGCGLNAKEARS